jgi:hypothetical protein
MISRSSVGGDMMALPTMLFSQEMSDRSNIAWTKPGLMIPQSGSEYRNEGWNCHSN